MAIKEYFLPQSLTEATELLAAHGPTLLVMGGGTLAMPLINDGIAMPEKVLGLRRASLNYVQCRNGTVQIGATTTLSQILRLEAVPLLQEAAYHTAGWSVRNMATVGGNLFAPPPYGDLAVALLALEAQVQLVSQKGVRVISLAEFYTARGLHALQADELLAEIHVPVATGKTVYIKYGRKHAVTPAIVTVAAHIVVDSMQVKEASLALNGIGPHPMRAKNAEGVLVGSALTPDLITVAAKAASEECTPFTDAVATEWYRRKMIEVYVKRALMHIAELER